MRQVRYNSICRQVVAVLGQCIVWRKNKASALFSWCGIKGLFLRQLDKFFECGIWFFVIRDPDWKKEVLFS
jgi:hypothetical protein